MVISVWAPLKQFYLTLFPLNKLMQAPVSPVLSPGAQPAAGATSLYGLTQLSSSTPSIAGPYPPIPSSTGPTSNNQKEQAFPERPGEPECQYYLKTGDCKFGVTCRYHHPRDRVLPETNCLLSPLGLPLRAVCEFCLCYFSFLNAKGLPIQDSLCHFIVYLYFSTVFLIY